MFGLMPRKVRPQREVAVRQGNGGEMQPWDDFRQEMNQLFDRFFGGEAFGNWPALENWGHASSNAIPMNLEDHDEEYLLRAEMPGIEPEAIDIQVSGNVLTVQAEHGEQSEGEKNGGRRSHYARFTRSLTLPHGVDPDKVSAEYRNGVLKIHLPKREDARGRRIKLVSRD